MTRTLKAKYMSQDTKVPGQQVEVQKLERYIDYFHDVKAENVKQVGKQVRSKNYSQHFEYNQDIEANVKD